MSIIIDNLTLTYDRHPAVHHLSIEISQGSLLAIVGPNGAGKSTLLNAVAGLIEVNEGRVEGNNVGSIAYLSQQTDLDKSFPMTVLDIVITGLWKQIGFSKSVNHEQYLQCKEAIVTVGLQGFENRFINTLSGGQFQRCLFARVLIQDQPIILLDEPFNAIDAKTLKDLTQVIQKWHMKGRTIIMVTHDMDYVKEHCPETLLLARESIGYGETHDVLTPENIHKANQLSEAFEEGANVCYQGANAYD